MDIQFVLPQLIPIAIAWAEEKSREILACGEPLTLTEMDLARRMGVIEANQIRIQMVDTLPLPEDPLLANVARATGLMGPNMTGLTLGHGIYICRGHRVNWLVSHECRHVHQYEKAGSISTFLHEYLTQIAMHGYDQAPLELDAYAHQVDY